MRNKVRVLLICLLIIVIVSAFFVGCNKKAPDLSGFSKENQQAIVDFVNAYGKNSKSYNNDAYIVSDFDNTTAIFDIAYQCSVYQIQTMAFAMNPQELRSALSTYVEDDETSQKYINDIINAYEQLIPLYGPFTPLGVEDEKLSEMQANIYWKEFAAKLKGLYTHIESVISDENACAWILYWYTNMTENEVYELYKRSCLKYQDVDSYEVTWTSPSDIQSEMGVTSCSFILGVSVTQSVKNMLLYYFENGIDTWICSASHVDGVRGAVDAYGLTDRITGVIGMTQKLVDGKFVSQYDYETGYPYVNNNGTWVKGDKPIKALPAREGKVKAIQNYLIPKYNAGPLAGFMDASGDFNFCTEFESMKMVICYNRADRKITEGAGLVAIAAVYQSDNKKDLLTANSEGDTLYLLQGRDENGKRSLRESNKTIKLGQTEEKLFRGQENETLYAYLTENKLSIKDYFDTFCIKTSAQDSAIGIAHGYLSEYSGYHSAK